MVLSYRELKNEKYLEATRNFAKSRLGIRFKDGTRAHCPFHQDATDSFRMYVNGSGDVRFHCFGECSSDWDIYDLIMMKERCGFGAAQSMFAEFLGVEIEKYVHNKDHPPDNRPEEPEQPVLPEQPELTDQHRQVMAEAAVFYRDLLLSRPDKFVKVIGYLSKRGVGEEEINKFNIGFCPALEDDEYKGRALLYDRKPIFYENYLLFHPYYQTSLLRLLDDETSSGFRYYRQHIDFSTPLWGRYADYFAGRITFPVYDLDEQIVGILGRKPNNQGLRWLKQSGEDTLINTKGWLYGINKAARWIKAYQSVILVEGIFDYFAFYNLSGNKDRPIVVSTLGARVDHRSMDLLHHLGAKNFIVAFDWDPAGRKGIIDAASQIKGSSSVHYLGSMKEGEDPADRLKNVLSRIGSFEVSHLAKGLDVKSPSGRPVMMSFLGQRKKGRKVVSDELVVKPAAALANVPQQDVPGQKDETKDYWYWIDDLLVFLSYDNRNKAQLDQRLHQIHGVLERPRKDIPPDDKIEGYLKIHRKFIEDEVYQKIGPALILHLRLAIEQQIRGRRVRETDSVIAGMLNTTRRTITNYKQQLKDEGLLNISITGVRQYLSVKHIPR